MTGEFRVDGKVVLVTGAARGQGASHARTLADAGARVMLTDILDDEGERVAAEIGDAARYRHHDVGSEADWAAVIEATRSEFGRLDVLINNAGVLRHAMIEDETVEGFERVVRINLLGVFLGLRAAIAPMREAGGGSIVNISSAAGLRGAPTEAAYVATKWAVRGLTKAAALELAPHRIRVNSVHPGPIDSPMIAEFGFERGEGKMPMSPLGRIGIPEEVSNLVLYLASDTSSYMTGAELAFDGGITLAFPSSLASLMDDEHVTMAID